MPSVTLNLTPEMNFQFREQEEMAQIWKFDKYWVCWTSTFLCFVKNFKAQSTGAVEYPNCISAEE